MAKFSIQRIFVSRRFIITLSIISIICSCLTIFGRYYLADYLIYAFAPPSDIIGIPLYIALCYAVYKNKSQLTVAIIPAILVLGLVSLLYYIMICFLPSVITLIPTDDYLTYVFHFALDSAFFVYILVIFFLTCSGKNLKKIIKFNSKLCVVFTLFVLITFVLTFFNPAVYEGGVSSSIVSIYDYLLENAFSLFSQIKLIIAVNVAVSLQAFNYLYTQRLLDNYI